MAVRNKCCQIRFIIFLLILPIIIISFCIFFEISKYVYLDHYYQVTEIPTYIPPDTEQIDEDIYNREDRLSIPKLHVNKVSCSKLFSGDRNEQQRALKYQDDNPKNVRSDSDFSKMAANCTYYKSLRKYIMHTLPTDDEDFPLAFSIILYKHVEQVERLLRAIYRPHNVYCLHVDYKSPRAVHDAINLIASCFDNVFAVSKKHSVSVKWGYYSVIEPDLVCMEELLKYKKWKYFINLTGQEFPLKTLSEIVRIVKEYKGANDIAGLPFAK